MDTAAMLSSRGHKVTVISQSAGRDWETEIDGVRVYKLGIPRLFKIKGSLLLLLLGFNWVVFRKLNELHRMQQFDLVDAPDHLAEGLFVALQRRIPLVVRLHTPFSLIVHLKLNNYKKNLTYYFIKFCESLMLGRSDVWYSPSNSVASLCRKFFEIDRPTMQFGYPIDLDLFAPDTTLTSLPVARKILFLGRLEQRKGIETIASAFPVLANLIPDVELTLLGSDTSNIQGFKSAKEFLKYSFESAGCDDRVRFADSVPLHELPDHIRANDILWTPSLYDNYPLVCIEAMACGKVVIAANSGGIPEFIKDMETGALFSAGDAQSLVDKTLTLLRDPQRIKEIGKNARQFACDNYREEHIYAQTMVLYDKALREFGMKID
jgi:glycosyltransferase involved in cell wall biosynthesis